MGYTHYYRVKPEFDPISFYEVSKDFKKMVPILSKLGVKLAGGDGKNTPIITPTKIVFNGVEKCGHTKHGLGITWPSRTAKGVSQQDQVMQSLETITKGTWFAGAELETRVCGGHCSHETFNLEQKDTTPDNYKQLDKDDFLFECTKTAYKPYDLAVNVCLVIAKHHLGKHIKVSSDGEMNNWEEGIQLCQHFLGYGDDFTLDE